MTTTLAAVLTGILMAGASTVGVIYSLDDHSTRQPVQPAANVVPYGQS